uniref:Uncharacterized protein n=2 Tax=Aegilops tauschii TaxID=37682 RepID=A0A453BPC4_AEGTS
MIWFLRLVVHVLDASPPSLRRGLASIATLIAWSHWQHHNAAVFDKIMPSTSDLVRAIMEEARSWAAAGAKGVNALIPVT